MKHNKKRNTAFIYETLTRELTKAIVDKNSERKETVLAIIKEGFGGDSTLAKELSLYKTLLETKNIQPKLAERMLQETKFAYSKLDSSEVFDAQSRMIAAINKQLGQDVWSNFVPNFKSLASVNAIFNTKTPVKSKVLFEQAIVDSMSAEQPLTDNNKKETLNNITYKSFIKKYKIKKLIQQIHKGPSPARNLGAKSAKGSILIYPDADIRYDKRYVETLIKPILTKKAIGTFNKEEYVANTEIN